MILGTTMNRVVAIVMIALTLTACQTPYSGIPDSELTPAQRELRDRERAFHKTVWEGVAVGAIAGALIGGLTGGARGAIIGAVGGGLVGGVAGDYVASKQRQYANQEGVLDSMIADVRQKNTEAESLVSSLQTVVDEDKRKLASANDDYQKGLIKKAEYDKRLASINADRKLIDSSIKDARDQHKTFSDAQASYKQSYPAADTTAFNSEVNRLGRNIDRMSEISSSLSGPGLG